MEIKNNLLDISILQYHLFDDTKIPYIVHLKYSNFIMNSLLDTFTKIL